MFDSGSSHYTTMTITSFQDVSSYDGSDSVYLGNGNSLPISHFGRYTVPTATKPFSLSIVLCVPQLNKNLVSVSKLCQTNHVSVEIFESYFLVKDQLIGIPLLRGSKIGGVSYAPWSFYIQINLVNYLSMHQLHHKFDHPSN
ncbi:hypothetical protein GQ457_06G013690 [Hibiscus cannabinus]